MRCLVWLNKWSINYCFSFQTLKYDKNSITTSKRHSALLKNNEKQCSSLLFTSQYSIFHFEDFKKTHTDNWNWFVADRYWFVFILYSESTAFLNVSNVLQCLPSIYFPLFDVPQIFDCVFHEQNNIEWKEVM